MERKPDEQNPDVKTPGQEGPDVQEPQAKPSGDDVEKPEQEEDDA